MTAAPKGGRYGMRGALRAGRRGLGCELNPEYFATSVRYLRAEEARSGAPTLFDVLAIEAVHTWGRTA